MFGLELQYRISFTIKIREEKNYLFSVVTVCTGNELLFEMSPDSG